MPGRLDGKFALITGAGRGIGSIIAEVFAKEGAGVAVNYSASEVGARRVVERISKGGGEGHPHQGRRLEPNRRQKNGVKDSECFRDHRHTGQQRRRSNP